MSSLLHQLSNESLLLMYLAGELSADDHGEVEQMLGRDPTLRGRLEDLRDAHDSTREAFASADAGERLAVPASAAARRVGQATRAWHARRLAQGPVEAGTGRKLRFPWWAYPVAAAAAVTFALVSWWGFQDGGTVRVAKWESPLQIALPEEPSVPRFVVTSLPDIPGGRDERDVVLDAAEDELYALSESSAGAWVGADPSGMMLPDETDER